MKETFPKKKSGDPLPTHIEHNKLTSAVQRLANQLPGSNLSGVHANSFSGIVGHSPWQQFVAIISNTKIDDSDTDDSGLYLCTIRYYDHTETADEKWKSRAREWLLDTSDFGALLLVDDKLTVWWNQQRRAFIPCAVPTIIQIMLKTSLEPDGVADAYPLDDEGEIIDVEQTIEVEDTIGDKRARGKDDVDGGDGDGAKGFVKLLADGTWAIIEIQQQAKRCSAILTADAGPGASVNVDNVVPLDGGQSPVDGSTDTLSATMRAADRALDNAACLIEWDETNDVWLITWVHQQARMLRGTLSGALAEEDESQTITDPVSMDGGQVPTGTLTGYNVFSFEADNGGEVFLVWNEAEDRYEIIQVECPA